MLMGPAAATGVVAGSSGLSQPFALDAGGYALIDLPADAEPTRSHIENKGFWITSSAPLTAKLIDDGDMVSLIGADKLGTEYFAVGESIGASKYLGTLSTHITIQAIEDNTTVTITSSAYWKDFNRMTLDAGQTYDFSSTANYDAISGVSVAADKPIAVITGNAGLTLLSDQERHDHFAAQIPPITVLSSSYLIPELPHSESEWERIWLVATEDNTMVKINGNPIPVTLSKGGKWDFLVKDGASVVATHPVLVAEYLKPQYTTSPPAYLYLSTYPAMTIVPGTEHWLTHYDLAVPSGSDYASHYVTLVAKTDSLGGLRVAGTPVDPAAFNPIGLTGYSYASVDVSGRSGAFTVTGDTPFELLQSGFGSSSSYLTYGANFPVNTPPPAPLSPPPPPCHGDSARVEAGGAVTINVLANDTAPSGALRIVSVSPSIQGGTATFNDDSSVQYVPPPGYTGVDSFSYVVKEAAGGTSAAQVDVDVIAPGAAGSDPLQPAAGGGPAASDSGGSAASPVVASSGRGGGGALRVQELLWLLGLSLVYAADGKRRRR